MQFKVEITMIYIYVYMYRYTHTYIQHIWRGPNMECYIMGYLLYIYICIYRDQQYWRCGSVWKWGIPQITTFLGKHDDCPAGLRVANFHTIPLELGNKHICKLGIASQGKLPSIMNQTPCTCKQDLRLLGKKEHVRTIFGGRGQLWVVKKVKD